MTGIKGIIQTHRARMEASGLLRQQAPSMLSPRTAAMRPSLTKVQAAIAERPDRFAVAQPSPLAILFEHTLPKLEPLLNELGEAKTQEIVNWLCEYGKRTMERADAEGSRQRLEELFTDLPGYEKNIRKRGGVDDVIQTYIKLGGGTVNKLYLMYKLGGKIKRIKENEGDLIDLEMKRSTNGSDLLCLRKAGNIDRLNLDETRVRDLSSLAHMAKLGSLHLYGTPVSDLAPLSGLTKLQALYISGTQVRDLAPLAGLAGLEELLMENTPVTDLSPLSGLAKLRVLNINGTQISDLTPLIGLAGLRNLCLKGSPFEPGQLVELKRALPRLEIFR